MNALLTAHGMDRHDVGMVQVGDGLGFALKPLHHLRVGGGAESQYFERNLALERNLLCFVNDPHAAAAHFVDDSKVAQLSRHAALRFCRPMDELDAGQTLFKLRGQFRMLGK